jgi:hypothetical protein
MESTPPQGSSSLATGVEEASKQEVEFGPATDAVSVFQFVSFSLTHPRKNLASAIFCPSTFTASYLGGTR